jgi:hypothetical protein
VPPKGFAEISITSPARTKILGDPTTVENYGAAARTGGVLLTQIALAGETGRC